jgi:hypothetical protein
MKVVRRSPEPSTTGGLAGSPVTRLPLQASDAEILSALSARTAAGGAALYDRYQRYVRQMLIRVLGRDIDLNDLVRACESPRGP